MPRALQVSVWGGGLWVCLVGSIQLGMSLMWLYCCLAADFFCITLPGAFVGAKCPARTDKMRYSVYSVYVRGQS